MKGWCWLEERKGEHILHGKIASVDDGNTEGEDRGWRGRKVDWVVREAGEGDAVTATRAVG